MLHALKLVKKETSAVPRCLRRVSPHEAIGAESQLSGRDASEVLDLLGIGNGSVLEVASRRKRNHQRSYVERKSFTSHSTRGGDTILSERSSLPARQPILQPGTFDKSSCILGPGEKRKYEENHASNTCTTEIASYGI
jgi:hypothetical protein